MSELNLYEKIVQRWQKNNISSVAELDRYLDNFRILFAYNSGKIENEDNPLKPELQLLSDA